MQLKLLTRPAATTLITREFYQSNKPPEMIPDKAPKEDVFHGSEELKKEAHIGSFDKYKELYMKSIESPDGKTPTPAVYICYLLYIYRSPASCNSPAASTFMFVKHVTLNCIKHFKFKYSIRISCSCENSGDFIFL